MWKGGKEIIYPEGMEPYQEVELNQDDQLDQD